MKVPAAGPQPARILLVGEAPGAEEEKHLRSFIGSSGIELTKMLNEAGILRTECRVTNVCKYRPPGNKIDLWIPEKKKDIRQGFISIYDKFVDPRVAEGIEELKTEILTTNPNVIIPLGNTPLWALAGETGITKWRGSFLSSRPEFGARTVVPTYHPAAILRMWSWRFLAVHDLRRAASVMDQQVVSPPEENFLVAPSYSDVESTIALLLSRLAAGEILPLAVDIETSRRHLACLGIAWSAHDALCIPFLTSAVEKDYNYWSLDQEAQIILMLRELLTHENVRCIGQNWQYDYQYIARYWGFEVNLWLDCMTEHHTQFPGLPKGLDFQSSIYRQYHRYWKDDGKEMGKGNEKQWWVYNCRDCVATWEIGQILHATRTTAPLRGTSYGTPHDIQQNLSAPMARASARGVKVDLDLRRKMVFVLHEDLREAEAWINAVLGRDFNSRSPKQMATLFYEEMGQAKILNRKTGKPTLNEEALRTIEKRDIILRPLCQAILRVRSLSNSLAVCMQQLGPGNRFHCQFTIPGTETFRFASSSDPFGFGSNGQNISSGQEENNEFPLPNLRKLFIPDQGFILGEFDLPQADARVVAWEAEDEDLIALFEDPSRDLHNENCEIIFGSRPRDSSDPRRYQAKQGVHLTNYGGNAKVLAAALGITVAEAERFQSRWFSAHPNIPRWHNKINMQLATKRYVENVFGYRRFYFDRIDGILKEALAWIPQSTVAIATNLGIIAATSNEKLRKLNLQLLLQCHDSSIFQWPKLFTPVVLPELTKLLTIEVPYAKPLIFQAGVKISDISWGHCATIKDSI